MKKLSVLGIVVGAALLSVAPVSIQPSPRNLVELSVNKAEALVYRRHYRRAYRRAYRSAYYGGIWPRRLLRRRLLLRERMPPFGDGLGQRDP